MRYIPSNMSISSRSSKLSTISSIYHRIKKIRGQKEQKWGERERERGTMSKSMYEGKRRFLRFDDSEGGRLEMRFLNCVILLEVGTLAWVPINDAIRLEVGARAWVALLIEGL